MIKIFTAIYFLLVTISITVLSFFTATQIIGLLCIIWCGLGAIALFLLTQKPKEKIITHLLPKQILQDLTAQTEPPFTKARKTMNIANLCGLPFFVIPSIFAHDIMPTVALGISAFMIFWLGQVVLHINNERKKRYRLYQ